MSLYHFLGLSFPICEMEGLGRMPSEVPSTVTPQGSAATPAANKGSGMGWDSADSLTVAGRGSVCQHSQRRAASPVCQSPRVRKVGEGGWHGAVAAVAVVHCSSVSLCVPGRVRAAEPSLLVLLRNKSHTSNEMYMEWMRLILPNHLFKSLHCPLPPPHTPFSLLSFLRR